MRLVFDSNESIVDKAGWLLTNDLQRSSIANAGFERVWSDSHDMEVAHWSFLSILIASFF